MSCTDHWLRFKSVAAQGQKKGHIHVTDSSPSPTPAPSRRPRALTYPLPAGRGITRMWKSKQKTFSQDWSLFFSRLPIELRLRIYEEVFGLRTVHIEVFPQYHLGKFMRSRYQHRVCHAAPYGIVWSDNCKWNEHFFCGNEKSFKLDPRLLRVCRRM